MAVNKVIYDGVTLVDLTGVTVTADNLAAGIKATGANGKPIVGLLPKVTIDAELSDSSENPLQNRAITQALTKIKNSIPSPYTLPTASASVLGGVKVGAGLTIDSGGVLSVPVRALTGTDDGEGNVTLKLMAGDSDVLTATDDGDGNIALRAD